MEGRSGFWRGPLCLSRGPLWLWRGLLLPWRGPLLPWRARSGFRGARSGFAGAHSGLNGACSGIGGASSQSSDPSEMKSWLRHCRYPFKCVVRTSNFPRRSRFPFRYKLVQSITYHCQCHFLTRSTTYCTTAYLIPT